ncbi:CSE1L [Cordylochernes scorpioides]|uniref:CSE1L n=1 Tax=Cordylochernes scorpioides TaxID=51811 RepID=A0ABY6JY02_9ARAC|nr:CSE1L [Cordylochernes scorpioides]
MLAVLTEVYCRETVTLRYNLDDGNKTCDVELFEDNPEEYIRRDIEGSDVDTRRRAACDLVRSLAANFESKIMEVFSKYIAAMLQSYSANPAQNWRNKDVAIYLVTSITIKGQTSKHGITQARSLVNITDFYRDYILPDLQAGDVDQLPVLKADAIKYLMIFRSQLPKEVLLASLPHLIHLMKASSVVVHTYTAYCVERFFTMQTPYSFSPAEVQHLTEPLLTSLFQVLEKPGSAENEYVMKAIMRTFSLLKEQVIPYLTVLLPKLTAMLRQVSKNPCKPHFNHYLFETLSLSIRIVCKSNPEAVTTFEEHFFPIFEEILQQDIQGACSDHNLTNPCAAEFVPYVFQVLSLMLEVHTGVPEAYVGMFPHLLHPNLWERPGNVRPLARLCQAYVEKGVAHIVASDKLSGLLGVFQKLIASKTNDHEGFNILQSLILHLDPQEWDKYQKAVFSLLFQRLHSTKTTKFVKNFLVFIFLYIHRYGLAPFIAIIDSIQSRMFGLILERLVMPDIQKVSGQVERKVCAVGLTKMLMELLTSAEYSQYWAPLLQSLIGLFELPEDESLPDDEHFVEIEESGGYQTAYSHLVFAGRRDRDPFNGAVPDARLHLAQSLGKLSMAQPGRLAPLISSGLAPEATAHLQKYLAAANIQLA